MLGTYGMQSGWGLEDDSSSKNDHPSLELDISLRKKNSSDGILVGAAHICHPVLDGLSLIIELCDRNFLQSHPQTEYCNNIIDAINAFEESTRAPQLIQREEALQT
jgi:hypothetical protein